MTPRNLPKGYYAENFTTVLETAAERYDDLLNDEEHAFASGFAALPEDARRLYVRLVSRRGPLFRRDLLNYPEIDLEPAITALCSPTSGDPSILFLDTAPDASPTEHLALARRAELLELAREHGVGTRSNARRREIETSLLDALGEDVTIDAIRARWQILRPLQGELVTVFRLLFFGNLYQDWSQFVLRDLGVQRYEPYSLDRQLRLFPNRAAVDDTLVLRAAGAWAEDAELDAAVEMARQVVIGEGAAEDGWHPVARRLSDRLICRVARRLERGGRDAEALELYEAASAPPSRERRARVLVRLGREVAALELAEDIATSPLDETEATFAPGFAHRLRRRRGEPLKAPRRPTRPRRDLLLARREDVPIERQVLGHLAAQGRSAFFSENWLWRSLFGLAFWDEVFAPVPGVFQHPFQGGPLDLHSATFCRARRELIGQRLEELRADPTPGPALLARWRDKRGTASTLVAWGEDVEPRLELALSCLDGPYLAWVCDRLSRDPGRYGRGFPDLFVLRDELRQADTPGSTPEPRFELWEVKGPGDQLRPEQSGWIDHLNAGGLPTSIVRVRWSEEG